jgi:hypothetical protein
MGKRSVFADVRDAFGSELNAGQQSALISWLAFTGTFGCVRGITHAIRAGRGPFKNLGELLRRPARAPRGGQAAAARARVLREKERKRKSGRLMDSPAPDGQATWVNRS